MNGVEQLVNELEVVSGISIWLLAVLMYLVFGLVLFVRYIGFNYHLPGPKIVKKIAIIAVVCWSIALAAITVDAAILHDLPVSIIGGGVIMLIAVFSIDRHLNEFFGITGDRYLTDTTALAKRLEIDEEKDPEPTNAQQDGAGQPAAAPKSKAE